MIPALFVYLFKANLALAIFCGIHYALLRRLTFVKGNRLVLLGGALCAVLLPLVPVNELLAKHEALQQVVVYYLPALPAPAAAPARPLAWDIARIVFWVGVTVMTIRFLIQLFSLYRLHRSARAIQLEGYRVHALQQHVSPFSFFRFIYLNPALHAPQLLPGILRHEAVHVRQWHTLDVILGGAVQIFAWFNPAAWLLQQAIRENLEFITDRTLLREGVNAQQYQISLLEVNGIPHATAIANNFNFSSLKNRIKMMNKQRSPQYQVLRYTIPVLAAMTLLLALNASKAALLPVKERISVLAAPLLAKTSDTSKPKKDTIRMSVSVSKRLPDTKPLPEVTVDTAIHATTSPRIKMQGSGIVMASTDTTGTYTGNRVVIVSGTGAQTLRKDTFHTATTLRLSGGSDPIRQPLIFINGKEASNDQLQKLTPNSINSISVLKDSSAMAIYGSRAANGVLLVEVKDTQK